MIALVLAVIADSIFATSMLRGAKSMSEKAGMAFACRMHVAELLHEYAVTITSFPAPQPHAATPMCNAAVPLFVVTACVLPFHAANSFSNATQFGPNA